MKYNLFASFHATLSRINRQTMYNNSNLGFSLLFSEQNDLKPIFNKKSETRKLSEN